MKLRGYEVRGIVILLTLVILGVMAACGGGSKSAQRAVLPQLDGSGSTASQGGKYGFSFTEADIPNLSPEIQELLALPGWEGPPTPVPPVSGAPMPEMPTVEDLIAMKRDLIDQSDGLYRNEEPVVPVVKDTSYPVIPPDDPGYYPLLAEYDPDDWDPGGGDTPPPPFGVDADEDGYEDLFENTDDWFVVVYKSFVKEGITIANQFNRGSQVGGDEVSAVYQSFRHEEGSEATGEFQYRSAESGILLNPYMLTGLWYEQFNMATRLTRYSDPTTVVWYAVMIAAASEVNDNGGAHFESTGCPNTTLADYQAFSYDPDKLPLLNVDSEGWDDNGSLVGSIMTSLVSSENENIQELIDEQTATVDPIATFGCMGMILQRWSDDRFSPFDHAWQGRLGWPLSDPWCDRNGRVLVGPLGQYRRYGQWFERGFIWWNDYLDPSTPDELYVYTTEEDSVLDPGAELMQDAMVVRYGLGGPLGMAITAYPLFANIGDPIYFHAFPYGGPLTNANAFEDDVFVWNWRDGNYYIGDGTELLRTHDYLVEAKYVPRVLLVLDVDGDGNADGSNPDYVCFADAPEIEIGHITGAGGGDAQIVIVTEDDPYPGDDNAEAIKETLDSLGILYDETTESDVSDVSDLEDYLLTIWCFHSYPDYGYQYVLSEPQSDLMMDVTRVSNQNLLVFWNRPYYYYNWYQFSDRYEWPNYWGSSSYSYPSTIRIGTTAPGNYGYITGGYPLGTGPGGTISMVNWEWEQSGSYYYSPYNAYLYYYYVDSYVTPLAYTYMAPYYIGCWMRDTNGGTENGIAAWFGLDWFKIESTTPADPGKEGVMQNLLNQINPALLEGGGGGGEDGVAPYDGPVDIADIFGWMVDTEAGNMSGGTDLDINVVGGPETINFECLARASAGVDLIYEWEFEPGDGYSIWTRYTAHTYIAALDIDGDGDTSYDNDDWFTVNARVYDSTYGSYASAPVDSRDMDVFDMRVSGGTTAVWIDDDGTVFMNPYEIDGSGNITVGLDYEVGGGDHNYNGIWIDYDYDFVTFNDTVEVTPTGTDGTFHYDLVIPNAQGGYEYYIAIRVYDDDAPNLYDTYAWLEPAMAGAGIVIINDGDTTQANLFADDFDDLGVSYAELNRSDLSTGSDLDGYGMVIWCATNSASLVIDTTEQGWLVDYVEGGGDLFVPHNYFGSQDTFSHPPYEDGSDFMKMFGVNYCININWSGNQNYMYSEDPWSSGPGGNFTSIHTSNNLKGHANVSWPDYQNPPNDDKLAYIATYYMPPGPEPHFGVAWGKDNLPSTNPGGKAAFWSPAWQYMDQEASRQNLLKNALDWWDPDLLP